MTEHATLIGILASLFTGISLLPQLYKIFKEKKANISVLTLAVLFLGNACWVWYGLLKEDKIIIFSNAFSILANLCVCISSYYFFQQSKKM